MIKTKIIAWFYLFIAIVMEVSGITSMKLSHGFTQLKPSILIFIFYTASLVFLMMALKRLEIGFTYAMWSGLGTLFIFFIGISMFEEPITLIKTLSLIFIIVGVVGLRSS